MTGFEDGFFILCGGIGLGIMFWGIGQFFHGTSDGEIDLDELAEEVSEILVKKEKPE